MYTICMANMLPKVDASAERSTALIKLSEREREALREASAADGVSPTRWCQLAVRAALEQRGYLLARLDPARVYSTPTSSGSPGLPVPELPWERDEPPSVDLFVPDVDDVKPHGAYSAIVTMRDGTQYEVGMSARDVRERLGIDEPETNGRGRDAANPLRESYASR